jgi:hypothetical protein
VNNEIGAVFNVRIEGDTDANLFYTDATNDKVGVGTVSPAEKLDVVGKIKLSDNLVIGTSGKGIDFSITSHPAGMTSELLSDYEEGTWTPVIVSTIGAITTYTSSATYTKIGRSVVNIIRINVTNNGTGAGAISLSGFPFSASTATGNSGATREDSAIGFGIVASGSGVALATLTKYDGTYPVGTGYGFTIAIVQNT